MELRRVTIKNKGYCLNCLAHDHERFECSSRYRCSYKYTERITCNGKHHNLLHRDLRDPLSSSFEENCPTPFDPDKNYDDDTNESASESASEPDLPTSKNAANNALHEMPKLELNQPEVQTSPESKSHSTQAT